MRINSTYFISQKNATKEIHTNLISDTRMGTVYRPSENQYRFLNRILCICRQRKSTNATKNLEISRVYKMLGFSESEIEKRLFESDGSVVDKDYLEDDKQQKIIKRDNMIKALEKMQNFFSEFGFSLSHRFVNSFCYSTNKQNFVKNYFIIQDHPYANEIADKIKSAEFKYICDTLNSPEHKMINTRLKLFFGEPGTGKTTEAMKHSDKCVVCSSDMLPADLMQNFAFDDGKAQFQKSDLWIAMETGSTIVLDEINMLPFESLRFLQGITDGKESFDYKGFNIKIHNGFNIIGTMNLNVNGSCLPLPAPLADRCSDIIEFNLDATTLIKSIMDI